MQISRYTYNFYISTSHKVFVYCKVVSEDTLKGKCFLFLFSAEFSYWLTSAYSYSYASRICNTFIDHLDRSCTLNNCDITSFLITYFRFFEVLFSIFLMQNYFAFISIYLKNIYRGNAY